MMIESQGGCIADLDPGFRPAVLSRRTFNGMAQVSGKQVLVRIALEQLDGSVFHHDDTVLLAGHPEAVAGQLQEGDYYRWIFQNEPEWQAFQ